MTSQAAVAPSSPNISTDCCMCGDHGLPDELFRCKVCQFRFQHRYCSNLYPKAELYRICNWCLNKEGVNIEASQQNPSLPYTNNSSEDDEKNVKNNIREEAIHPKVQRSSLHLHPHNPMKKHKLPEKSSAARKKIVPRGCLDETYRRTKPAEEISNTVVTKQVFRGKARRYKLLDEVSS
ncbi:PREDICTED: uncharacterized protein LOC104603948 [Nelumbo nucifera]|uniref:Uncharacterized protein LOC104603948 n=1 Tax=Nelumbo nucifera TaxID=4432 RepID=A0A1U8ATI0_NELNU|nr:PREDICTED: uncharacterized protein LOC104603948 [Nelumbo nucifera]